MSWHRIAQIILTIAVVAPQATVAEDMSGLKAFLDTYRCSVVERLERIHARGDRSTSRNRFLILASHSMGEYYLQCMFHDNDTEMFCEAASGFYAPKDFYFQLWPPQLAALKRLGFSTDASMGNFNRDINTRTPADFPAVADLMLSTLYEVYGVRGADLKWGETPFTPELKGMPTSCVPIG